MPLLAFGINHKTAPVELREKVAFSPPQVSAALKELPTLPAVQLAAILSTCIRTELVCYLEEDQSQTVVDWFQHYHKLKGDKLSPYLYLYPDQFAVRHLLRVAAGLDSMILGEPQILGQMKEAYLTALKSGTVGTQLGRLNQHTFSVAKQVRTDTAIGASPVAVAFAAVSLAKQIFSDFSKHTALLIGAGETIELTARHLQEQGIGRIVFVFCLVVLVFVLVFVFGGFAI